MMGARRILLLIAASVAVVLGVIWYIVGGFPRDHDAYGAIRLGFIDQGTTQKQIQEAIAKGDPTAIQGLNEDLQKGANRGSAKVDVPEGEVRLNWEGGIQSFGNSRSASEAPDDLQVTVISATGDGQIETEKSGGYDSVIGDTGWTSWRKFEAREAGTYIVAASSPSGDAGELTIGKGFWNPLGSRVLGAFVPVLLVGVLVLGIAGIAAAFRRS